MFSGPDTPIVIVGNKLDLVRELPKVKFKSNLYITEKGKSVINNISQNSRTDQAKILSGTWHHPRKGFWMIRISKLCSQQDSIFITFRKCKNKYFKIREPYLLLFDNVHSFDGLILNQV